MLKRFLVVAIAAGCLLAAGYADQSKSKIVIGVVKTNPTDGKQMYSSYCAPCHGQDGRGNGPAAKALKAQPTDLTGLARAHNGKFPDAHVVAVLRFGTEVPAHGSVDMPVWGRLFAKMSPVSPSDRELRMGNLTRYLESIQQK